MNLNSLDCFFCVLNYATRLLVGFACILVVEGINITHGSYPAFAQLLSLNLDWSRTGEANKVDRKH